MNIVKRAKSPTPKFFRTLRTIGLAAAAAGTALITAPVTLPAAVASIAGYLTVAGGVIGAVSQLTTAADAPSKQKEGANEP